MIATAEQVQKLGEFWTNIWGTEGPCNLQHSALAGWRKDIKDKAISPLEDAIDRLEEGP